MESFIIRKATEKDIPVILSLINELAVYEKLSVIADENSLHEWIFEKEKAEVLIGEYNGLPIGYAVYFHNFSTFLGRAGIYLEDIYVKPDFRGKGLGKAFFKKVAATAVERGCGRMEWTCLDWNLTSIDFYRAMGAEQLNEWLLFRITGDKLNQLAEEIS
ncbi:MAG: GNAT family N-acetyltransferase [Bacteroidales bacterium]|jgi:GNAT superfamily N-acetyltransferase|nr:GNAT family N-acetyltransferase [Bacteroidales bacterium]